MTLYCPNCGKQLSDYAEFCGSFGIKIPAAGNECVMLLREYDAYEGREYLIADMWMSEEDRTDFLMMRGQEQEYGEILYEMRSRTETGIEVLPDMRNSGS